MKKLVQLQLFLIVLICLCGCSAGNNTPETQPATDVTASDISNTKAEDTSSVNDAIVDSAYMLNTESKYSFYTMYIINNPIDSAYKGEKLSDDSVNAMVEKEFKYMEKWREELAYSCESLRALLTEEQAISFDIAQKSWEDSLDCNYSFIKETILFGVIPSGELYNFEVAFDMREAYRQRTIYIKYLQYCLDSSNNIDFCHMT